jgi:hypothetical protein
MRFMFGLPTVTGWYDILVTNSILNQHAFIIEGHHQLINNVISHTLIHSARGQIAMSAIKNKCDYLFFIDSDCVLPPDALKRLVAHDKDIVAGMYFHKTAPFAPVVYKIGEKNLYDVMMDYPKNTVMEVDGVGMGCCLIKTSVFEKFVHDVNGQQECYAFEPIPATKKRPSITGEDFAFCHRAQEAGYKIYVDTGLQCKHQTVRYIDEEYWEKTKERIKAAEASNKN